MTVLMPFGRAVTKSLFPRSGQLFTRQIVPNSLLRVSYGCDNDSSSKVKFREILSTRSFSSSASSKDAATSAKPVGRPKAHTGRAPAKKRTPKSTSASTLTKRAAAGAKGGSKKTTAKKAVTKKPKAKASPKKPVKAKRVRKPLSKTAVKANEIAERKDLKKLALLDQPKALPSSAWAVYFTENKSQGLRLPESSAHVRELSSKFHDLPPAEREQLNHTANQNKLKNDTNMKQWLSQYTPMQIKEANKARQKVADAKRPTASGRKHPAMLIKDDRLVQPSTSGFILFTKDRWASGDFKSMRASESGKLIGREWKELSESDRKAYMDRGREDRNRYIEEYTSVYGVAPGTPTRKTKAKTSASS